MISSDAKFSRYCFCCSVYMGICSSFCTVLSRPWIVSASVFQMRSCQRIWKVSPAKESSLDSSSGPALLGKDRERTVKEMQRLFCSGRERTVEKSLIQSFFSQNSLSHNRTRDRNKHRQRTVFPGFFQILYRVEKKGKNQILCMEWMRNNEWELSNCSWTSEPQGMPRVLQDLLEFRLCLPS